MRVFYVVALLLILVVATTFFLGTTKNRLIQRKLYDYEEDIFTHTFENGFELTVSLLATRHSIQINKEGRVLWTGSEGRFVRAAIANADIQEERGSFEVEDCIDQVTDSATIRSVSLLDNNNDQQHDLVRIEGDLLQRKKKRMGLWEYYGGQKELVVVTYQLDIFVPTTGSPMTQLSFSLTLPTNHGGHYNRVFLQHDIDKEEQFFGFGEQFTNLNLRGKKVTIITSENGIARGEPGLINFVLNIVGVNGQFDSTYAPAPYYLTNRGRAFFLENYEISQFDMQADDIMRVKVFSDNMRGRWIYGETPLDIIESYTDFTGRMQPLPTWMNRGAIVGMQGGTEEVLTVYEELLARETPMGAFWLQDWVGRRQTCFGSQLWWNWNLNDDRYPNWYNMVRILNESETRVMTYINPFLVDVPEDYQGDRLFDIAKEMGYFVLDKDGDQPYLIQNTDFSAALLDLTNPSARIWIKDIIKNNVIGVGASGWMADFGEALPIDATLYSGENSETYHNRYPEEWARINQEAVAEANRTGDIVFFMRSGFTRSPGLSTLFWEGDQLVTWDENDGLKSAITGLLSSGISGFSLNHNDIGGYTTIKVPLLISKTRSRELLFRWMEMNAFTAVFRTHEGIQPENNVQFYTDAETLDFFTKFAKIYGVLADYREILMQEAAEKGYPVVRHPFLHYPDDPVAYKLRYQWMLGSEFMIAPVTDKGQKSVRFYLPEGSWTYLWDRDIVYEGGSAWHKIDAPIGKPAVFFKTSSSAGRDVQDKIMFL